MVYTRDLLKRKRRRPVVRKLPPIRSLSRLYRPSRLYRKTKRNPSSSSFRRRVRTLLPSKFGFPVRKRVKGATFRFLSLAKEGFLVGSGGSLGEKYPPSFLKKEVLSAARFRWGRWRFYSPKLIRFNPHPPHPSFLFPPSNPRERNPYFSALFSRVLEGWLGFLRLKSELERSAVGPASLPSLLPLRKIKGGWLFRSAGFRFFMPNSQTLPVSLPRTRWREFVANRSGLLAFRLVNLLLFNLLRFPHPYFLTRVGLTHLKPVWALALSGWNSLFSNSNRLHPLPIPFLPLLPLRAKQFGFGSRSRILFRSRFGLRFVGLNRLASSWFRFSSRLSTKFERVWLARHFRLQLPSALSGLSLYLNRSRTLRLLRRGRRRFKFYGRVLASPSRFQVRPGSRPNQVPSKSARFNPELSFRGGHGRKRVVAFGPTGGGRVITFPLLKRKRGRKRTLKRQLRVHPSLKKPFKYASTR